MLSPFENRKYEVVMGQMEKDKFLVWPEDFKNVDYYGYFNETNKTDFTFSQVDWPYPKRTKGNAKSSKQTLRPRIDKFIGHNGTYILIKEYPENELRIHWMASFYQVPTLLRVNEFVIEIEKGEEKSISEKAIFKHFSEIHEMNPIFDYFFVVIPTHQYAWEDHEPLVFLENHERGFGVFIFFGEELVSDLKPQNEEDESNDSLKIKTDLAYLYKRAVALITEQSELWVSEQTSLEAIKEIVESYQKTKEYPENKLEYLRSIKSGADLLWQSLIEQNMECVNILRRREIMEINKCLSQLQTIRDMFFTEANLKFLEKEDRLIGGEFIVIFLVVFSYFVWRIVKGRRKIKMMMSKKVA